MAKDMASRKAVCILVRDPTSKADVSGVIYFEQKVRLGSLFIVKKGGFFPPSPFAVGSVNWKGCVVILPVGTNCGLEVPDRLFFCRLLFPGSNAEPKRMSRISGLILQVETSCSLGSCSFGRSSGCEPLGFLL